MPKPITLTELQDIIANDFRYYLTLVNEEGQDPNVADELAKTQIATIKSFILNDVIGADEAVPGYPPGEGATVGVITSTSKLAQNILRQEQREKVAQS